MADAARHVILVLGTLQLLLSSGLVLGWMGFVLMFRGEGIFSADCSADERNSGACDKGEELALTTIYTAGLAGKTMSPLPLGLIVDRCESPRLVGVVFAVGTTLGFFLLAISDSQGIIAFGVWFFSFFGSGIQLNLFQVASLFPDAKGLVMGWFTTLFGFSALVPMMLFRVWEWLDSPSDARSTLFLWYSALLCIFVAFSATIGVKFNDGDRVRWGWRGFELVPEVAIPSPPRAMSRRVSVVGVTISQHLTPLNLPEAIQEGKDTKTSGCTEEACTADYKVFLLFFTLHFFRSLFYLGAVDSQVTSIAGSTIAPEREQFVAINGWIKPFGTLVGPPIGHIIHRRKDDGVAFVASLVVVTSALHGFAAVVGVFWLLPVAYAGAALAEESVITMMFTYIEYRFGFDHFGTLTGAVLFINGMVAMLVYPFMNAIVTPWTANATHVVYREGETGVVPFFVWRQINVGFLVATMVSAAYPAWLYRRDRRTKVLEVTSSRAETKLRTITPEEPSM